MKYLKKRLQFAPDDLDGIICIAVDILVYGIGDSEVDAIEDHDKKLNKLLERCSKHGIRLNRDKVEHCKPEITFLGHKITCNGLKADPSKIEAIIKMKAPSNVTEVQRFGGMINYLSKFLPRLSDVMEPIRQLARKDVFWYWGKK